MAVWETPDVLRPLTAAALEYAPIWQSAEKIVYSTTLQAVTTAKTRLERRFDADVVRELKAGAIRDIAVGGPTLAACSWILTVLAVKRAVIDGRHAAWLAAGVCAGLTLLSKLLGLFLFAATALFLAASPEGRRWARRFEPYAAAALALLLFSPVVWWNVRHGLFTIAMRVGHQSAGGLSLKFPAELLAAQGVTVTPLLFVWVLWGLLRAIRGRRDARLALLAAYTIVPFGFYFAYSLFARSGIHWPAIGYPTGFLAAVLLSTLRYLLRPIRPHAGERERKRTPGNSATTFS